MESFCDEDGSSCCQVRFARDICRSAQVGTNAKTFDHRGEGNEAGWVGHRESVLAGFYGLSTCGGEAGLEVENMSFLVVGNVLELVVEVL